MPYTADQIIQFFSDFSCKKISEKLGSYKKFPKDCTDKECSICLQVYLKNEGYRDLRCGHRFHKRCVDRWFKSGSNTCPLCREPAWDEGCTSRLFMMVLTYSPDD